MRKLVEFLTTRMDTHPEEFYEERKSGVKFNWVQLIKNNKKFMTDKEYDAVWEKLSSINLDYQMERVTEKLFEPEDEELKWEHNPYTAPTNIVANQQQIELLKEYHRRQQEQMKLSLEASVFRKELNESNSDRR